MDSIDRLTALAGSEATPEERARAVRYVAGAVEDADAVREILDALGLNAREGKRDA